MAWGLRLSLAWHLQTYRRAKYLLCLVVGHGPLSHVVGILHCHIHTILHAHHVDLVLLLLLGGHIRTQVAQHLLLRILSHSLVLQGGVSIGTDIKSNAYLR